MPPDEVPDEVKKAAEEMNYALQDYLNEKRNLDKQEEHESTPLCGKFKALNSLSVAFSGIVSHIDSKHHDNPVFLSIMLDFSQDLNNRISSLLTDIRMDMR